MNILTTGHALKHKELCRIGVIPNAKTSTEHGSAGTQVTDTNITYNCVKP